MRSAASTCLCAVVAVVMVPTAASANSPKGARPSNQAPKLPIIQIGLVPGGRTNYACITARQPIALYDRPYAQTVRGYLKAGDTVLVERHELHVWPQVVTVVFTHPPFRVGDTFYMLAYEEENYRQVWYHGAIDPRYDFIGDEVAMQDERFCERCSPVPSERCWLHAGPDGRERWWLRLRLPMGETAWTDQPDLFNEREDKVCAKGAPSRRRR